MKPMPVSEYADGERTLEYVTGALFFLFLLLLFAAARFVDLDGDDVNWRERDKGGDGK